MTTWSPRWPERARFACGCGKLAGCTNPDCPYPDTRRLTEWQDRVMWLRLLIRPTARADALREYWGISDTWTDTADLAVTAASKRKWFGAPEAVTCCAVATERAAGRAFAVRHAAALRHAVEPLARAGAAGHAILDAVARAEARLDEAGVGLWLDPQELTEVTRRIAHAVRPRGRGAGGMRRHAG
jgi:hypothetical protein